MSNAKKPVIPVATGAVRQGSAQHIGPAASAATASTSSVTSRPASASKLAGAKPTIIAPVSVVPDRAVPIAELGLKEAIELVMRTPRPEQLQSSCVLLIDPTSRATTFLRHRDVNYLSAMNKEAMTPERIRLALIGAIRYRKPISIGKYLQNGAFLEINFWEGKHNRIGLKYGEYA
jgi:hypothetical protein